MKNIILIIFAIIFLPGCTGCSKSGRFKKKAKSENVEAVQLRPSSSIKTVVKMEEENGVYKIPILVNGTSMDFIFDTGAGMISISNIEASYLYKQGKLGKDDILGTAKFIDANGNITVGTVINLKEITIGDRAIYNISASVVDNSVAPLLFGQSALAKFGKISIDYGKSQITFE